MSDPSDVAKRYAGARPGFELIHFQPVGIPFYRLGLNSLIQRPKPIGPIHEFVLRSVAAGLDQVDDVAGFLGVERTLLDITVVDLASQDLLDYRLESGHRVLRLTPLGRRSIDELVQIVPDRVELNVGFDRVTWRVNSKYLRHLIAPREARELGLLELPARLKKRLSPQDIDLDDAQRDLHTNSSSDMEKTELISVSDVSNRRMLLPATALVYVSEGGKDQQVALALDGRISEAHGLAFSEYQGPVSCGLIAETESHIAQAPDLPPAVQARRASRQEVVALEAQRSQALRALSDARTATATATAGLGDRGDAEAALEASATAVRDVNRQLAELPIRSIQTYEHRVLLEKATKEAASRILIISPWVRSDVVDRSFISSLEACARRGVVISIGWGINNDHDELAKRPLEQLGFLAGRYSNVTVARVGNTHAKILVWDDNLVVTSFNWLSFKGDKRRGFRQEEGTLITDSFYVETEYAKYLGQITASSESH
jgi:hypothetical protein